MEAIGINDLSKQYAHGKHKALDGLSLVLDGRHEPGPDRS